ncbi:MAG: formyltetrahydrofolate deformylase [Microlunatus sp.]|nr:formyltetrahydrofolate deformylase [Microlunatus sp.]
MTATTVPETAARVATPRPGTHHDVLTLRCPQRSGIVNAVTSFLVDHGLDITEHQQFDDQMSARLFLRTAFVGRSGPDLDELRAGFAPIADRYQMDARFYDQTPDRLLIMVSKLGHCLNDLIFRWRAGSLGAEIAVIVSNHETHRPMADAAGLPFVHIPITPETKPEAEARLEALISEHHIDLVVLARYMQVLSDGLCSRLDGWAINIHHSFLPSFKGAKPYHQAYARGVKMVGATAHYVTPELDEGPIIEQEIIRVDHTFDPDALATVGRDAEALALSRAVRWHSQRRVLRNGASTVVFR